MDQSAASCYVYSKASGMLVKSFTGPRAANLFHARSLQELWTLLFKEEIPSVPQTVFAEVLEKKAVEQFVNDYKKLLKTYSKPDKILVALLHYFEYENLKHIGSRMITGLTDKPEIIDIKPYGILKMEKWPDIAKMTEGTELSWIDHIPSLSEQQEYANKIDVQFYKKVIEAANDLPQSQRNVVVELLSENYSLKNIIWAMRLKVFYNMEPKEIKKRLVYFDDAHRKNDLFAGQALKILDWRIDSYDDWAKWKYEKFLNKNNETSFWKLDPQTVEINVRKAFNLKMQRTFHKYPFTPIVMLSWFFIKANEIDYIRTATEALRLNVDENLAMQMSGIQ